jgi:hypothetical protein
MAVDHLNARGRPVTPQRSCKDESRNQQGSERQGPASEQVQGDQAPPE